MKSKKSFASKGASQLAAIVEAHLEQLSPAGRAEKMKALNQVIARIGIRAKWRTGLQP
jgi:hypothetical protein